MAFLGLVLLAPAVRAADFGAISESKETGPPATITLTSPDLNPPIGGRVDPTTYPIGPGD
jgi:hypothetical protein